MRGRTEVARGESRRHKPEQSEGLGHNNDSAGSADGVVKLQRAHKESSELIRVSNAHNKTDNGKLTFCIDKKGARSVLIHDRAPSDSLHNEKHRLRRQLKEKD